MAEPDDALAALVHVRINPVGRGGCAVVDAGVSLEDSTVWVVRDLSVADGRVQRSGVRVVRHRQATCGEGEAARQRTNAAFAGICGRLAGCLSRQSNLPLVTFGIKLLFHSLELQLVVYPLHVRQRLLPCSSSPNSDSIQAVKQRLGPPTVCSVNVGAVNIVILP